MSALVPTLRSVLEHADALFDAGRVPAALAAFEDLLVRAQDKGDRTMEAIARAMVARCLLRKRDLYGAEAALWEVEKRLAPDDVEVGRRMWAAKARLWVARAQRPAEDDSPLEPERSVEVVRDYLDWSRDHAAWAEAIDACRLLSELGTRVEDRVSWLQMAADIAVEHDVEALAGRVFNDLAVMLETSERPEDALDAWERAHDAYRRQGTTRQVVSAAWAAGALACRTDDWPLAQIRLEQAVKAAERADDSGDLLALALADLAAVHEASGDIVEGRRAMIRAITLAREHDLPRAWPERWRAMMAHARRLDVE